MKLAYENDSCYNTSPEQAMSEFAKQTVNFNILVHQLPRGCVTVSQLQYIDI